VRQVLCLFGWFRDYIPHYAELAIPLSNLTTKRVATRIPWGNTEQRSFDTLKELLCRAVDQPLSIMNWKKPSIYIQMPVTWPLEVFYHRLMNRDDAIGINC